MVYKRTFYRQLPDDARPVTSESVGLIPYAPYSSNGVVLYQRPSTMQLLWELNLDPIAEYIEHGGNRRYIGLRDVSKELAIAYFYTISDPTLLRVASKVLANRIRQTVGETQFNCVVTVQQKGPSFALQLAGELGIENAIVLWNEPRKDWGTDYPSPVIYNAVTGSGKHLYISPWDDELLDELFIEGLRTSGILFGDDVISSVGTAIATHTRLGDYGLGVGHIAAIFKEWLEGSQDTPLSVPINHLLDMPTFKIADRERLGNFMELEHSNNQIT